MDFHEIPISNYFNNSASKENYAVKFFNKIFLKLEFLDLTG